MDRRKLEDSMNELAHRAKPVKDESMVRFINRITDSGGKIYVATDFHLYKREKKGSSKCHKRSNYDAIHTALCKLTSQDLLIYLGDLVDGEFMQKELLKDFFKDLKCQIIMCLGNNDLFEYGFYRDLGIRYVLYAFEYKNMIFSHYPIDNNGLYNIHGHIHNSKTYWTPYKNHIDVAYFGGREKPIELYSIANPKAFKEYSSKIKEDPSHFNEQAAMDLFNSYLYSYDDPVDD